MGNDVMGNDGSHDVPAKATPLHQPVRFHGKGLTQHIQDRLRPSNERSATLKTVTHPTRTAHAVHHSGSQGHHGATTDKERGPGRQGEMVAQCGASSRLSEHIGPPKTPTQSWRSGQ
jgi:hypothetical protein